MSENTVMLHAHIDMKEMDEATKKAERLNDLLKEASSIIDELAAKRTIEISVDVKD